MKNHLLTRRGANAALLAFFGAASFAVASPALAQARDPGAEAFVQTKAQRVISVLANKGMSDTQKKQVFHQAVDELADVPRITNFVLGKYARTISSEQRARFTLALTPPPCGFGEADYGPRHDHVLNETRKAAGLAEAEVAVAGNGEHVGAGDIGWQRDDQRRAIAAAPRSDRHRHVHGDERQRESERRQQEEPREQCRSQGGECVCGRPIAGARCLD